MEPTNKFALFLELEKAPCQLNHAASNAGIASASKTLLSPAVATLIGCTCEAGVAGDRPSIPQRSRKDFVHQHVGRFDARANNPIVDGP
jgi:hypothetical protein